VNFLCFWAAKSLGDRGLNFTNLDHHQTWQSLVMIDRDWALAKKEKKERLKYLQEKIMAARPAYLPVCHNYIKLFCSAPMDNCT